MPARLIQKKRKSFGQDAFDESIENGQKRRCLGTLDYTSGNGFPVQQEMCWDGEMNEEDDTVFYSRGPVTTESNNNSFYNYNLVNSHLNNNTTEHSSSFTNGSDHQISQQEDPSALTNGCDMEFDSSHETNTSAASTTATTTTSSSYYEQLNVILGPADRFCVGGDFTHRPGLNRSYCKPSWDAMTDMRPYVSDYY